MINNQLYINTEKNKNRLLSFENSPLKSSLNVPINKH